MLFSQDFQRVEIVSEVRKQDLQPYSTYRGTITCEKWKILFRTAYGYSTWDLFFEIFRFFLTNSMDSLWFLITLSIVTSMPFGSCPNYTLSLCTVIPHLQRPIFVSWSLAVATESDRIMEYGLLSSTIVWPFNLKNDLLSFPVNEPFFVLLVFPTLLIHQKWRKVSPVICILC